MRIGDVLTGMGTVLILSKRIGRHRPQNRIAKSSLPLPARKETGASRLARHEVVHQGMRGIVPILSVMKVGRDRPQLCARESSGQVSPALGSRT
jgi:hypothetical protein